jgi:hypothetical protein
MSLSDDDFEKVRHEVAFEQVSKAIKENPKNWAKKLEELGFQWVDDESGEEEVEEDIAKSQNLNQERLLDAFYELEQHMAPGSDKAKIVQKIRQEQELEPECVKF